MTTCSGAGVAQLNWPMIRSQTVMSRCLCMQLRVFFRVLGPSVAAVPGLPGLGEQTVLRRALDEAKNAIAIAETPRPRRPAERRAQAHDIGALHRVLHTWQADTP